MLVAVWFVGEALTQVVSNQQGRGHGGFKGAACVTQAVQHKSCHSKQEVVTTVVWTSL